MPSAHFCLWLHVGFHCINGLEQFSFPLALQQTTKTVNKYLYQPPLCMALRGRGAQGDPPHCPLPGLPRRAAGRGKRGPLWPRSRGEASPVMGRRKGLPQRPLPRHPPPCRLPPAGRGAVRGCGDARGWALRRDASRLSQLSPPRPLPHMMPIKRRERRQTQNPQAAGPCFSFRLSQRPCPPPLIPSPLKRSIAEETVGPARRLSLPLKPGPRLPVPGARAFPACITFPPPRPGLLALPRDNTGRGAGPPTRIQQQRGGQSRDPRPEPPPPPPGRARPASPAPERAGRAGQAGGRAAARLPQMMNAAVPCSSRSRGAEVTCWQAFFFFLFLHAPIFLMLCMQYLCWRTEARLSPVNRVPEFTMTLLSSQCPTLKETASKKFLLWPGRDKALITWDHITGGTQPGSPEELFF